MPAVVLDLTPARLDLWFSRGDDFDVTFNFVDGNGVALNWSGRTFTAKLRADPDATAATSFTVNAAAISSGVLVLSLPAATTALLGSEYVWDLQRVDGSSKTLTILAGTISVPRDVTH